MFVSVCSRELDRVRKALSDFILRRLLPTLLMLTGFVHPCLLRAQGNQLPAASGAEFSGSRND